MTEAILAGWLTPALYLFLFALTVWVASHGLEIFGSGNGDLTVPVEAACGRLSGLTMEMNEKVKRIERWAGKLVRKIRSCEDPEGAVGMLSAVLPQLSQQEVKVLVEKIQSAENGKEARQLFIEVPLVDVAKEKVRGQLVRLNHLRGAVPGNDVAAWFEKRGVPSSVMEHVFKEEAPGESADKSGADSPSRPFLAHEASEYNWRLGAAASLAPIAGMAPTMTGAIQFLGDYSSSIKEGSAQLPLSGLNTALFTTCWGCCLTIASIIFLSYVMKRKIPRAREMVQKIENPLRQARHEWDAAIALSSRLGKCGVSYV